MTATLDHLVIGGTDLGLLVAWWKQQTGTDAVRGGSHPGMGSHNALIGVDGSTYVELIAHDPDQPDPQQPRPFGIDALEPNSVQLCTMVLAVPDIASAAAAFRDAGLNPGKVFPAERTRADGVTLRWQLAIPPDPKLRGAQPSLIQWGDSTPHPGSVLPPAVRIEEVSVGLPDPTKLAAALASIGSDLMVAETPAPMVTAHLAVPGGPDFWL